MRKLTLLFLISQLFAPPMAQAIENGKSVNARANSDILMFGHFDVKKDPNDPSKVRATGGNFCTGTMVSPTTILTAAHCVANEDDLVVNTEFFIQPRVDMFRDWATSTWEQLRQQIEASKIQIYQAKNVIVFSPYTSLQPQVRDLERKYNSMYTLLWQQDFDKQITRDQFLDAYSSPGFTNLRSEYLKTSAIEHAFDLALIVLDEEALAPYRPRKFRKISGRLPIGGDEITLFGYGVKNLEEEDNMFLSLPRLLQAGEFQASPQRKVTWRMKNRSIDLSSDMLEATVGAGGHQSQALGGDSGGPVFDSSGEITALDVARNSSIEIVSKHDYSEVTTDYFTTFGTPLKRKFFEAAERCHASESLQVAIISNPQGPCAAIAELAPL